MKRKLSQSLGTGASVAGIRAILRTDSVTVRIGIFLALSALFYLFVETTDRQSGVAPILARDTTVATPSQDPAR